MGTEYPLDTSEDQMKSLMLESLIAGLPVEILTALFVFAFESTQLFLIIQIII